MTISRTPTRCKHCKAKFTQEERGLRIHSGCIDGFVAALQAKKRAKQEAEKRAKAKVERALDKAKKRAFRKLSEFKADAQRAFNAFIRTRDADLPCVSCGETNPPMLPGGQWDAGHFLSRGAYPELAFNEDNCHKQCKSCNAGSGKFSHKARTVGQKYEKELLRRIGPDRLAVLKGPHPPAKLGREDYEAIEATYKAKRKELERNDQD